jgi:hypothetical protein
MNNNLETENAGVEIPDFDANGDNITMREVAENNNMQEKQINIDQIENLESIKDENRMMSLSKGLFFLVFGILLLIGGYYAYNYAQDFLNFGNKAVEKRLVFENPLIRADTSRVISIEAGAVKELVRKTIVETMRNEQVAKDTLTIVTPSYLRDKVVGNERNLVSEPVRGDEFMFVFAGRSPLRLKTVAAENYALGVVGTQTGNKNFMSFSVSAPQEAIAELRRYEPTMYEDMKDLLNLRNINGNLSYVESSQNNHILRVASDADGVVFVYGFGAPRTVIITKDTETFEFAYSRLK